MAESIIIKRFSAMEDGATDWKTIRKSFSDIEEVLNEHAGELKALAKHSTFQISGMFQTKGRHFLANSGKHPRFKIVNAFAMVHDNIEEEVHVSIVNFTQEIKFNGSEKKGSGKIFDLHPGKVAHFTDAIEVELTGNRRISVYATCQSIEEE